MHASEFIEVLLAKQAVFAEGEAVVAGHDEDRVIVLARLTQGLDDTTNLGIPVGDRCIITGQLSRDTFSSAGPGKGSLIAYRHIADVEGVIREKIHRQRNLLRLVHFVELFGGLLGVVGFRRCHVEEHRFFARILSDKLDEVSCVLPGIVATRMLIKLVFQFLRSVA